MRLLGLNTEDVSQKRESWRSRRKVFWLFLPQKISCQKNGKNEEQQSLQVRQKRVMQEHSAAAEQTNNGLVAGSITSFQLAGRVVLR